MITADDAVVMVDRSPNMMPRELVKMEVEAGPDGGDVAGEVLASSRKTPTKNPAVTMAQEERTRRDGRDARKR